MLNSEPYIGIQRSYDFFRVKSEVKQLNVWTDPSVKEVDGRRNASIDGADSFGIHEWLIFGQVVFIHQRLIINNLAIYFDLQRRSRDVPLSRFCLMDSFFLSDSIENSQDPCSLNRL